MMAAVRYRHKSLINEGRLQAQIKLALCHVPITRQSRSALDLPDSPGGLLYVSQRSADQVGLCKMGSVPTLYVLMAGYDPSRSLYVMPHTVRSTYPFARCPSKVSSPTGDVL